MADAGKLIDYLRRLTGKPVTADTAVSLGSAKKAQLAAWMRKEGYAFTYADIDRPSVTAAALLGGGAAAIPASSAPTPRAPAAETPAVALAATTLRIGMDLEAEANMPIADDLRAHPFYAENFSPREIAHALQRGDARASLCGLWAAKEAVVKAGAVAKPPGGALRSVEIGHDAAGAPTYPCCTLSITHEAGMAAAVCLWFGAPTPEAPAP